MTIVYCTSTVYNAGGLEKVLIQKANYLAEHCGCEVYIVTFHQKGRPTFFPLSDKVHLVDLGANIRIPLLIPLFRHRLGKLLEEVRADVLICLSGIELGPISRMKCSCPKIAEFHFSYNSYIVRKKQYRLPKFIRAARRMDRFVVLTREDAAEWSKVLNNVAQIYNPADINPAPLGTGRPLRCISGGRLVPQKNYDAMLELWSRVAKDFPDWRLDIYGKGPLHEHLTSLIKELGLEGGVSLNPPTGNFRQELESSSIYLMTSIYEGFPMSLIEAADAGVPAIAFSCPAGPAEAIIDGETGYVIPEGNISLMAERLRTLMSSPELRAEMGRNAEKRCADFDIKEIMGQWTDLFREVKKK